MSYCFVIETEYGVLRLAVVMFKYVQVKALAYTSPRMNVEIITLIFLVLIS